MSLLPEIKFSSGPLSCPGIPQRDADGLTNLVNRYDSECYASTTTASMTSCMRKFWMFLTRHRLWHTNVDGSNPVVPPLAAIHLIFYVGFILWTGEFKVGHGSHKSYASICQYASTLRTWCRTNERPDPAICPILGTPDMRYVRFMQSIKRRLAGRATRRKPMSLEKFKAAIMVIRYLVVPLGAERRDLLAAMLLAFFALLRVSEYTCPTKGEPFNPSIHATRGDIIFIPNMINPERITVEVKVSKTDQWRVGVTLPIYRSGDDEFCPVMALRDLFINDPQPLSAPLFDFTSRTQNAPHRQRSSYRGSYIALFNTVCTAIGLSSKEYQSHSLRSGGASAMLRAGIAPVIITKLGRWASFCWTRYTWASYHSVQQAHRSIAQDNPCNAPVDLNLVRYA